MEMAELGAELVGGRVYSLIAQRKHVLEYKMFQEQPTLTRDQMFAAWKSLDDLERTIIKATLEFCKESGAAKPEWLKDNL